jgi:hypothetical protein
MKTLISLLLNPENSPKTLLLSPKPTIIGLENVM